MLFIAGAFLVYLALISYRCVRFVPPVAHQDWRYRLILIGCLVSDFVAAYGFYALIKVAPAQTRNYTLIVTALALVAAAVIVGKFAFRREGTGPAQRFSVWALPVILMFVLYLLFGAIAYFSKIIQDTNLGALAYIFIPALMLAVLWINTAYDHWDYAERSE